MIYVICLGVSILIGVFGQIQLKMAATQIDYSSFKNIVMNNPHLLLGLGLYGISVAFYILSLQKIPLSIAFPSVSLSYIGVVILSAYLFNEPINGWHMFGLGMIIVGVFSLGVAALK